MHCSSLRTQQKGKYTYGQALYGSYTWLLMCLKTSMLLQQYACTPQTGCLVGRISAAYIYQREQQAVCNTPRQKSNAINTGIQVWASLRGLLEYEDTIQRCAAFCLSLLLASCLAKLAKRRCA